MNEAGFSVAVVPFSERGGDLHLIVGSARDTFLAPRSCSTGILRTYKISEDGRQLEFLHEVGPGFLFNPQISNSEDSL